MKKFLKIIGGIVSFAAVAFGAYCVYKNVIAKKEDDFDDFDDCFEDEEATDNQDREYVSINITADSDETPAKEEDAPEADKASEE